MQSLVTRSSGRRLAILIFADGALLLGASAPMAAAAGALVELSIEELSNIEVTSVSRREERLSDVAASVYVITGDEIRRPGPKFNAAFI